MNLTAIPKKTTAETFEQRLLTLSTGGRGLRAAMQVTAKAPEEADLQGQPVLDFIASDATLDRYDEVIEASGWKLDNYKRNPVFQNSHQYGDILFTLGKALLTEIRGGALFQRILFAVDANPVAKIAYSLYQGGFLNAVSVGFIPLRWENGSQQTQWSRRYLEQELLELSSVAIPANPNALMQGIKSGSLAESDIRAACDVMRAFLDAHKNFGTQTGSSTQVSASGAGADDAQVRQMLATGRECLAALTKKSA